MLTTSATLFLLPALAAAQYAYGPQDPTGSSSTTAAAAALAVPSAPVSTSGKINVDVGFQGQFKFNPPNITAPVGTLVTFYFPANPAHSVTQSSFGAPCTYLASTSSTPAGFDSGLVTASTFTINVTDDQPIWFHCKQTSHCPSGMVGSINAPTTGNTFDAFQAAARGVSNPPSDGNTGAVTGGVHGVATAGPSSDTGSGSTPSPSSPSSAIKVVGSAGVALLAAALAIVMA